MFLFVKFTKKLCQVACYHLCQQSFGISPTLGNLHEGWDFWTIPMKVSGTFHGKRPDNPTLREGSNGPDFKDFLITSNRVVSHDFH